MTPVKAGKPSFPRLRLHPQLKTVRAGSDTLVFIGGPAYVRMTGPSIARLVVPLLGALDGRSTARDILARAEPGDRDRIAGILAELEAGGLLERADGARREWAHPAADFLGRYASLAHGEPAMALALQHGFLVRAQPGHGAYIAAILRATGFRVALQGPAPEPGACLAASRMDDGGRHFEAGLGYPIADRPAELRWTQARAAGYPGEGEAPAEFPPPAGGRLPAAIAAHWALMASAGMPVSPTLTTHDLPAAPGPVLPAPAPAISPARVAAPDGDLATLARIGSFAVGSAGGRHVAPTAGNLHSAHLLCLTPRPGRMALHMFDADGGGFDLLAEIPASDVLGALEIVPGEICLILVGAVERLRARYGDKAERLAHHDGGFALDHAVRAARILGRKSRRLREERVTPLLEDALSFRGRLLITAALGLSPPVEGGLHAATAGGSVSTALDAMLGRRSTREFAPPPPGIGQLRSVERALRGEAYSDTPWRDMSSSMRLYRLRRGQNGNAMSEVALRGRERERLLHAGGDSFLSSQLILQPDLAAAPVIYLFGHEDAPRPDDLAPASLRDRRRWVDEGMLCSALWVEARARGLAGAPYGGVDTQRLALGCAPSLSRLCLCLGQADRPRAPAQIDAGPQPG